MKGCQAEKGEIRMGLGGWEFLSQQNETGWLHIKKPTDGCRWAF